MSDFLNNPNRRNDKQPDGKNAVYLVPEDVDLSVLLDFEAAQRVGDPDLIVELIDIYLANVPQQLAIMKDLVAKGAEKPLKRAAHNLKGSSANLGAKAVAVICQEIEQADSYPSFQELKILINLLEQAFARIRPIFLAERQRRV